MILQVFEIPINFNRRVNVEVAVYPSDPYRSEWEILNVDMDEPGIDTLDDKIEWLDSHIDDLREQITDYINDAL